MSYLISGKVIKGDGYGKKIGFPTVNLETKKKDMLPSGIYSGNVILDGKKYRAGIVVGPGEKIEGHLIGYNENAYGKEVTIQIKKFLRQYKKFDTEEELITQIKKDLKLC
ncbi:MAG: riboflavin kinase [Patescibacteria group bacterium]